MKYALVTGGGRGIGRAVSIQLARDGFCVIINYKRDAESAGQTLKAILEEGGSAELLPFDVSSPEEVDTALKSWNEGRPGEHVDVLVNNAGIVRNSLFLEMELEQWKEVIDTDLNSFFHVTRRVLEEVAYLVSFLVSDRASFISGQVIGVNGGTI